MHLLQVSGKDNILSYFTILCKLYANKICKMLVFFTLSCHNIDRTVQLLNSKIFGTDKSLSVQTEKLITCIL